MCSSVFGLFLIMVILLNCVAVNAYDIAFLAAMPRFMEMTCGICPVQCGRCPEVNMTMMVDRYVDSEPSLE